MDRKLIELVKEDADFRSFLEHSIEPAALHQARKFHTHYPDGIIRKKHGLKRSVEMYTINLNQPLCRVR